MGSSGSKNKQFSEDVQEEHNPTTPITPVSNKKFTEFDPRSPSTHFSRTPIQLLSDATEKVDELGDSSVYELSDETPGKAKTVILGIDPRSPTTEFTRTPIVVNIEESELPKRIHNKNLDKVKQSAIITTPKSSTEKTSIPPKLLESSPIKAKADVHKRKSFVGLLETNIDFTETDLDVVQQEKCKTRENENEFSTPSGKVRIATVNNENIDPRSPSTDFLRTPIQFTEEVGDYETHAEDSDEVILELQNDLLDKIEIEEIVHEICEVIQVENEDVDEQSIDILSTETVKAEKIPPPSTKDEAVDTSDLNIPIETKSAPVTPPTNSTKTQKSICPPSSIGKHAKSAPATPPVVDITADVNELDKKLTDLIYQDEDIVVCPRIVQLKDHGNRSPLRSCNGTEPNRRKSTHKLRVSDKPRKSDYVVSKIPVFKEKGKNQVQCENTPPRNIEKRKMKVAKSQWDNADKTLII